jgi:hypothetical protein
VRTLLVVDLEAEGVLEVVAGLLVVKAGDHSGAFGNVKYLRPACLRQPSGGGVDLLDGRHLVCTSAKVELMQRADIAQLADADAAQLRLLGRAGDPAPIARQAPRVLVTSDRVAEGRARRPPERPLPL